MRTVSRDDQLVERGANPRTGLVSPFAVSDDSEDCTGGDYIIVDKVISACPSPERRTRSRKWRQYSLGWSLVESPLLNPIPQIVSDKMSGTVSVKRLADRPLVQTPGVDDPEPKNMVDEQIKRYQAGIFRAYKRRGEYVAVLDPGTLPIPRRWTPPSTPPTRVQKVLRKEVGSGVVGKYNSGDAFIINANDRESSLSTSRTNIVKRQVLKIFTPSNTPKGSSFESCLNISNTSKTTDPLLNQGSRLHTYQSCQNESESSPSTTLFPLPPDSQTLREYLPKLKLLHPSHFAKPDTSSYRRPKLRVPGDHMPTVEDACIFTTASKKGQMWEQERKTKRQHGNDIVPRVHYPFPRYHKPLYGYHQEIMSRNKRSSPSDIPLTERSRGTGPTEHIRKTQMPAKFCRQHPYEKRPKNLANPPHMTQGLCIRSANIALERIQQILNGDGCTPTYGYHGNEISSVLEGNIPYILDDTHQATLPAELTIGGDSKAGFTE